MQILVANTTKQNVHFHYRLPEHQRLYDLKIPIGAQERLHKADATSAEVAAIEKQLREGLGAVRMDEVDRTRGFIGICYSIDKPVKAEVIERAVDHNDDVLTDRGFEQRKTSAVAISSALTEEREQDGVPAHRFKEIEIVQDVKPGDEGLKETYKMDPAAEGRGNRRRK